MIGPDLAPDDTGGRILDIGDRAPARIVARDD